MHVADSRAPGRLADSLRGCYRNQIGHEESNRGGMRSKHGTHLENALHSPPYPQEHHAQEFVVARILWRMEGARRSAFQLRRRAPTISSRAAATSAGPLRERSTPLGEELVSVFAGDHTRRPFPQERPPLAKWHGGYP